MPSDNELLLPSVVFSEIPGHQPEIFESQGLDLEDGTSEYYGRAFEDGPAHSEPHSEPNLSPIMNHNIGFGLPPKSPSEDSDAYYADAKDWEIELKMLLEPEKPSQTNKLTKKDKRP